MGKALRVFLTICAVTLFAVGLALIVPGLQLALRADATCHDVVMHDGDRCPNYLSTRSWNAEHTPTYYDVDKQRARNQQEGFQLAGFGALALFAGGLFAFGLVYARRFADRPPSAEPPIDLMRSNKFRISMLVVGTAMGSIYPVGQFVVSDPRDWTTLLMIPFAALVMVFGMFVYPKFRRS